MSEDFGEAALSEGFCPFCDAPLWPLDPEQREVAATWFSPPVAFCSRCFGFVGRCTVGGGTFVAYGPLTPREVPS